MELSLAVIGAERVGKTSLITKFIDNRMDNNNILVGNYRLKIYKEYKLKIYEYLTFDRIDTKIDGIILMFNQYDAFTFLPCLDYVRLNPTKPIILVGNHNRKYYENKINDTIIDQFVNNNKLVFYDIDISNYNVKYIIDKLIEEIMQKQIPDNIFTDSTLDSTSIDDDNYNDNDNAKQQFIPNNESNKSNKAKKSKRKLFPFDSNEMKYNNRCCNIF